MAKRTIIRLNGRTSRPLTLGERSARALVGTGKFAYADEVPIGSAEDLLIAAYAEQSAEPIQEPEDVFTDEPEDISPPEPEPQEPSEESEVEISPRTGLPKRRYRRRETPTE